MFSCDTVSYAYMAVSICLHVCFPKLKYRHVLSKKLWKIFKKSEDFQHNYLPVTNHSASRVKSQARETAGTWSEGVDRALRAGPTDDD